MRLLAKSNAKSSVPTVNTKVSTIGSVGVCRVPSPPKLDTKAVQVCQIYDAASSVDMSIYTPPDAPTINSKDMHSNMNSTSFSRMKLDGTVSKLDDRPSTLCHQTSSADMSIFTTPSPVEPLSDTIPAALSDPPSCIIPSARSDPSLPQSSRHGSENAQNFPFLFGTNSSDDNETNETELDLQTIASDSVVTGISSRKILLGDGDTKLDSSFEESNRNPIARRWRSLIHTISPHHLSKTKTVPKYNSDVQPATKFTRLTNEARPTNTFCATRKLVSKHSSGKPKKYDISKMGTSAKTLFIQRLQHRAKMHRKTLYITVNDKDPRIVGFGPEDETDLGSSSGG